MEHYPDAWSELSAVQRDIMVILAYDGPLTGREVTSARGVTHCAESTTYRNIDHLVAEGYVRKGDKDRRARFYGLTPSGADLVRRAVVETGVDLVGRVAADADV